MPDVIYIRERAQKYNMENGFSRSDGQGGRFIKQGLMVAFDAISDENPTATFNATKTAEYWVNAEIVAGNIEEVKRESAIESKLEDVRRYIENHDHFSKPDKTGQNLIWREPSKEDRVKSLKAQAEILIKQAEEIAQADTADEVEEKLDELKKTLAPQPNKKNISKPVGIITGGATASTPERGNVPQNRE